MKILIVCNVDSYQNPYVKTLYNGLVSQGIDVTCSIEEFWINAISYDIIHIQWPNLLVEKSDESCSKLQCVISDLKALSIPLVCTCHNLVPHYNSGAAINNAYSIIYNNCDYIHHLGEVSIQLLKDLYPGMSAKHIVIPHHTYDEIYRFEISKDEARKKIGVPKNVNCVLSFGSFRHDEERQLLIDLSKKMKKQNVYFLAPGFYRSVILRKNIFLGLKALYNTIKYSIVAKFNNIHICHSYVSDNLLPYYLIAADVMLIQRVKILNSGNVSLAMLAGLPIVGPDEGNVGSILKDTGNFVFDPRSKRNISLLVHSALSSKGIGESNKQYAEINLTTMSVVQKLVDFYNSIK